MVGGEKHKNLFTISDVTKVLNVISVINGIDKVGISSVVIDSREVCKGSLFVPLPGLKTDGHNFLLDAIKRGVSAVFVASSWIDRIDFSLSEVLTKYGVVALVVNDPLKAMQDLARFYLERWYGARKVGITGSNGKTTTKEMVASILSVSNKVFYNEKNFNSIIGLPLSVFRIVKHPDYIVFEMATNQPGEMAMLADIFKPDIGLITNVGRAHVGNFGSKRAIAEEKRNIFKDFNESNLAFVFEGASYFDLLIEGIEAKIIRFGEKSTRGYEGCEDLGLDGYTIYWEGLQIRIPFIGKHNVINALAAITVAMELGIDKWDIKVGLERIKPLFGRSEIVRGDYVFLVDCYNANPDSMERAIESFRKIKWKGKKIAVLGDMYELGDFSHEEHYKVAVNALKAGFDFVVFFGEEFLQVKDYFNSKDLSEMGAKKVLWVKNFDVLVRDIKGVISKGDLILLKASRGVELERIIPAIEKNVA